MDLEHIKILKMLIRRLFTPIEVIAFTIFDADGDRTEKTINQLENKNLIEYALNGRVVITAKGRSYLHYQLKKQVQK
jgi:ribosomal protein S19E (S16A)